MVFIYETKNFIVEAREKPHLTRTDGGHITISPKNHIENRWDLTPKEAIELMRLTIVTGKAMKIGLRKNGIRIERINFQDNGNWAYILKKKPFLHIHLYGRAKNSKYQKFGEALYFPKCGSEFFNKTEPLNEKDIREIRKLVISYLKLKKFSDSEWGL